MPLMRMVDRKGTQSEGGPRDGGVTVLVCLGNVLMLVPSAGAVSSRRRRGSFAPALLPTRTGEASELHGTKN